MKIAVGTVSISTSGPKLRDVEFLRNSELWPRNAESGRHTSDSRETDVTRRTRQALSTGDVI